MLTTKAAALLLIADHVTAFIANAPAFAASGLAEQAGMASLRRPGARFSRRGELALSSRDAAPSWRYEVDDLIKAASPWGSLVEAEIIATDLLKRLPEVAADVSDATRRGKLLSEVVLARGTEARLTVEGVKAVNRQLREEILPKALESAPRVAKAVSKSRSNTRSRRGSTGGDGGDGGARTSGDSRKGPMEGVAETLYSIRNSARGLTPRKIRDGLQTVAAETENVFSRTPAGLFSPEFSVEDAREGFEVRRYASYAVCSATMAGANATTYEDESTLNNDPGITTGSGEGFNTLAGYLFGNNTQERAMDMTTPVNIDVSPAGGRTMSFVLPKDLSAEDAPTPRNPSIRVDDVDDGELLAVREFPGFATDGEVKRQLDSLLGSLEREASLPWSESAEVAKDQSVSPWRAEDPSGLSYRLMQYNPPYTLPWLRTNAVAVKVLQGEAEPAQWGGAVDSPIAVVVDEGGGGRDQASSAASQA